MAEPSNKVFVVYGRNAEAQRAMFTFLRSIALAPMEWETAVAATGKAAPYTGDVLKAAFAIAQAVVVLMTPDEVAYLRTEYADTPAETVPGTQARPNVLFEAGMALGLHEDRTVIVELGELREVSDYLGRHAIRNITTTKGLKAVAERLKTAGCPVDLSGSDWMDPSQFQVPPPAAGDLPLGKRAVASPSTSRPPVDVKWHSRSKGNGSFEVYNYSGQSLRQVSVEALAEDEQRSGIDIGDTEPLKRLPAGKSASFNAFAIGAPSNTEILVCAIKEDGTELREEVFVNMRG